MRLSRKLRKRHYYKVPEAGAQVAFSRAESYRAAERGDIPTERDGKFLAGATQAMGPDQEADF